MEKMELCILMIIIFAFGYIAVVRFSRFVDKVHRDTYNYKHIASKPSIEWMDDEGTFEMEQEAELFQDSHWEKTFADSDEKE